MTLVYLSFYIIFLLFSVAGAWSVRPFLQPLVINLITAFSMFYRLLVNIS